MTIRLKPENLAAYALSILAAFGVPHSAHCAEAPSVLVTLDQNVDENGLCQVYYKDLARTAPCKQIVAVMQSELRIPDHAQVTLRASKTARYEHVSQLLQALRDAGYDMKIGYMNSQ